MMTYPTLPPHLRIGNWLFRRAFRLYRPLYFLYKRVTERPILQVIRQHVRPGMTALDIGANIGFFSLALARQVGQSGVIHAFEPEAANYAHLAQALGNMNNVVLNRAAVGSVDAAVKLYLSPDLNADHRTYDSGDGRPFTLVPGITVDDYFRRDETVDFIKLDIQGYEYEAVMGMQRTLRRSPRVIMCSEFWPYGLHKAGVVPSDYLGLLRSLGLEVRIMAGERDYNSLIDNPRFYTNLVAVRRDA